MTDKKPKKKPTTSPHQEQILKAGMEVFSHKGYAAATVAEIAKMAGVATGTIYLYYPSKRELFIAVIKNLIITTPLLDLIEKLDQEDISVTFKHIMQDRFRLIDSEPMSRMPSLMGEIQRDPELKALWAEKFIQPFLSQLDGGYRFMMASGKFRRLEPAVAVRAVGGLIVGFLLLKIMEGESSPINQLKSEKVAEDLANFVLHGLLNDTGEKKIDKEDAL